MLHQRSGTDHLDSLEIAAVWPASAQIAPFPIPDIEPDQAAPVFAPEPAVSRNPAGPGTASLSACAALIAAIAVVMAQPAASLIAFAAAIF